MKFTNGYWRIREEIEPCYAVEYIDHEFQKDCLVVYASARHIENRGDMINAPMLTVTISSPMEDVIKISAVHFKGAFYRPPYFETNHSFPAVLMEDCGDYLVFQSGDTSVRIIKAAGQWKMEFRDSERLITESGFRNLAYMVNQDTKKKYMVEQLALGVGESVYGLGERYSPFVKNGQTVEIWNEDGGTASDQTYKNIPFYVTNRGYGVFVDNPSDVQFEVGSEKVERVQFSAEGERLDYYVINGKTPKNTVRLYTDLTGKPALPPAWSFGLWLTTSFTTSYDEKTVTSFIDGMAERHIPLHTFHFDCFWMKGFEWCNFEWDPDTFPDPAAMLKRYKDKGLHICVWINSYIGQKSKLFDEGLELGYFVKNEDGSVWQCDRWQAGMGLVDFTNPLACKWYQDKLEQLIDMGVDCFKTDFGERIPVTGVCYYDGSEPLKMHNYYTYLYNKTVFEILEKKLGKDNALVFARSTTAGGQKFPVHWGGDCTATYSSMAEDLRGGLSLSLSGYGFWSHDISGFEQTASPDIYKRWAAFGLLSSHSRLHGSKSYRVPWAFDEEACDVLRFFVNLKCSLMPYIYGQAVLAHKTGIPMLRPMFFEFPEDIACEPVDRQYMFGDSLLVAPIFKEDGSTDYYLPEGLWTDYFSGEVKEGGHWYHGQYDYFSLPFYVKENTILPIGDRKDRPDYHYTEHVTLRLYQIQDETRTGIAIPNQDGSVGMRAEVVRKKDVIMVTADQDVMGWEVEVVGQAGKIVKAGNTATVYLTHNL